MHYIIDFIQAATDREIQEYFAEHSCTVVQEYDHFEKVFLVSADNAPEQTDLIESIVNDSTAVIKLLSTVVNANNYCALPNPDLESIVVSTSDDKDWWKNYVMYTPDFENPEFTLSRKGAMSRVYIMDSGIDAEHPEFKDANINNLYSFTGEFKDTNGHGTALASLIVGKTCGLSAANVQVVKVFDATTDTRQSDLLAALDAIMNDFMANSTGLGVVNLSWSIDKNVYIESKIKALIDAGMYVVVSAGNSGVPIENVTPASMPEVLTIGSINKDLKPSDFSNYSNSAISVTESETNHGELDGWAPGEEIWVAIPGGSYGYSAGTSIAAAIHTCALAYNFSDYFLNGELPVTSRGRDLDYISGMSLGHKDLIHLEDAKYSNSVNRFTAVINSKSLDHFTQRTEFDLLFTVGKPYTSIIFNPQKTKTAEFDLLPEGFLVTSNGLIVGTPTLAEGVTHEIHIVKMTVTMVDGSVVVATLNLAVMASDFDPSTAPEGDPIIQITLLDESCRFGGCRDDCEHYLGGYSTCPQDNPKAQSCYCT